MLRTVKPSRLIMYRKSYRSETRRSRHLPKCCLQFSKVLGRQTFSYSVSLEPAKLQAARSVVDRLAKKATDLKTDVTVLFVNAKIAGGSAYKVLFEFAEELGINKGQEKQVHFTGLSMGEATDRVLHFIQRKKLNLVLVIDEIDSLVDRSGDDILYNFTRANQRMKGGFITLIGISNSLTFKDKLDPRVRSEPQRGRNSLQSLHSGPVAPDITGAR